MRKKNGLFHRAKVKMVREFKKKYENIKSDDDKIKILLLTNRDSDNTGDQVIEACDISLISTVMKNLGFKMYDYKIISRAAGMISKKYLSTKNPELLKSAEKSIQDADLIIFGGAPLFNYKYQVFYERTAITLELAEKHNKPVIFSAIGVEGYDENNAKCQRLKKTLNFNCVKQITTRDNFESLEHFRDNENIKISKVSDPAVFTSEIFEKFKSEKGSKKKIGIFIIRANAFVDNKIDFTKYEAAQLWVDLAHRLEQEGYDYEFLTSGHFADEAFLDYLIRVFDIKTKKCVFNMDSPEKLVSKISSYDVVVSTRLHPSIVSYSLGVPAIGIEWNFKVPYFYESIGYGNRVLSTDEITADLIMDRVGSCMEEGVTRDMEHLMTVYNTLFDGIKTIVAPEKKDAKPYTYNEFKSNLTLFDGTPQKEKNEKLKRKFRRTYNSYNAGLDRNEKLNEELKKLRNARQ